MLRIELIATGEQDSTWGATLDTQLGTIMEAAIAGRSAVTHDDTAAYTLTTVNGAADEARRAILNIAGTLTAARQIVCPTKSKLYVIKNATTGGYAITLKTSAGTGISIPNGKTMFLMCDGTNVVDAIDYLSTLTIGSGLTVTAGNVVATAGNITATAGNLTFGAASAKIIPGATSLLVRNNADSASNIVITDAGEITKPLQPAFLAYNSVTDSNITGNGSTATVDFDTEIFDQGSDFSSDTFTAPVTGRYKLSAVVELDQLSGATRVDLKIVTSNRSYTFRAIRTMGNTECFILAVVADMDAADTATVTIMATGIGADTADVSGSSTLATYFSGFLAC